MCSQDGVAHGPPAEQEKETMAKSSQPPATPSPADVTASAERLERARASFEKLPLGKRAKAAADRLKKRSPKQVAELAGAGAERREAMLKEGARAWVHKKK